jgi:hypothetical protein
MYGGCAKLRKVMPSGFCKKISTLFLVCKYLAGSILLVKNLANLVLPPRGSAFFFIFFGFYFFFGLMSGEA